MPQPVTTESLMNFCAVQVEIMRAVLDKGIHFAEGTFIQQQINAFAGGQASLFVLRFDALRSAAQARLVPSDHADVVSSFGCSCSSLL